VCASHHHGLTCNLWTENEIAPLDRLDQHKLSMSDSQFKVLVKRIDSLNRSVMERRRSLARTPSTHTSVMEDEEGAASGVSPSSQRPGSGQRAPASGSSAAGSSSPNLLTASSGAAAGGGLGVKRSDTLGSSTDADGPEELLTSFDDAGKTLTELERECAQQRWNLFDLTAEECLHLRPYAILDLTALMEKHLQCMPVGRKRSLRYSLKGRGVQRGRSMKGGRPMSMAAGDQPAQQTLFGMPVNAIVQAGPRRARPPLFVEKAIAFLENEVHQEGLFRKMGSAARVKKLKEHSDMFGGDVDFVAADARAHDVATLLKQLFREMPEALFTDKYSETYIGLQGVRGVDEQIRALQLLSIILADSHVATLKVRCVGASSVNGL
jgi:hypothetical protein